MGRRRRQRNNRIRVRPAALPVKESRRDPCLQIRDEVSWFGNTGVELVITNAASIGNRVEKDCPKLALRVLARQPSRVRFGS